MEQLNQSEFHRKGKKYKNISSPETMGTQTQITNLVENNGILKCSKDNGDTYNQIKVDYAVHSEDADSAVKFTNQTLTAEQQQQARENIDAVGTADLGVIQPKSDPLSPPTETSPYVIFNDTDKSAYVRKVYQTAENTLYPPEAGCLYYAIIKGDYGVDFRNKFKIVWMTDDRLTANAGGVVSINSHYYAEILNIKYCSVGMYDTIDDVEYAIKNNSTEYTAVTYLRYYDNTRSGSPSNPVVKSNVTAEFSYPYNLYKSSSGNSVTADYSTANINDPFDGNVDGMYTNVYVKLLDENDTAGTYPDMTVGNANNALEADIAEKVKNALTININGTATEYDGSSAKTVEIEQRDDVVTLDGEQTITGKKTFSENTAFDKKVTAQAASIENTGGSLNLDQAANAATITALDSASEPYGIITFDHGTISGLNSPCVISSTPYVEADAEGQRYVRLYSPANKPTPADIGAQPAGDYATVAQVNAKYTKPETGIPKTDLADSVQASLDKADTALQSAPVTSVAGKTGAVTLVKADVGLGNVDNTSDANKPVSTAQQAALDLKQNVNDNSLATTAKTVTGAINEAVADIATLESDLNSLEGKTVKLSGQSKQTIAGNIGIEGNLTVSGTTITNDTETLAVKDNIIVTNSEGADLVANSGLAIRVDTSDSYGIVYTPADHAVKLGLGKLNASNEFDFNANEGNPIAVRSEDTELTEGHLIAWDSVERKLIDGGAKPSALPNPQALSINGSVYNGSAAVSVTINKTTLGLNNVDNTSDANKPISTATRNALDAETAAREQEDIILQNSLNNEITNRTAADTALGKRIDGVIDGTAPVENAKNAINATNAGTAKNYDTTNGTINTKFVTIDASVNKAGQDISAANAEITKIKDGTTTVGKATEADTAYNYSTAGGEIKVKFDAIDGEITNIKNGTTIVPNANIASHAATATNYDTTTGNIKSKFDELEEKIDSGGTPSNMMTTDTVQDVTGQKKFGDYKLVIEDHSDFVANDIDINSNPTDNKYAYFNGKDKNGKMIGAIGFKHEAGTGYTEVYLQAQHGDNLGGNLGIKTKTGTSDVFAYAPNPSGTSNNQAIATTLWVNNRRPKINGSDGYRNYSNFYAPTDIGSSGYVLMSVGSGAPSWSNINMYPKSRANFSLPSSGCNSFEKRLYMRI